MDIAACIIFCILIYYNQYTMTIKRMFKFTLPALLFAAGVTAYAAGEGPILLKDGTTAVTWQQFATALNNPSSLGGDIPEALVTALNEANAAYQAAVDAIPGLESTATGTQSAYETALTDYNDAVENQNAWTAQLTTLQSQRSKLQEQRNTKQNTDLPALNKQLTDKQAQLPSLLAPLKTTLQQNLATQQKALNQQDVKIAQKEVEIENLQSGSATGETKTAQWLTDTKTACQEFTDNDFKKSATTGTIYFKYDYTPETADDDSYGILTISFLPQTVTSGNTDPAKGWVKADGKTFYAFVVTNWATNEIHEVRVYFGNTTPMFGKTGYLNVNYYTSSKIAAQSFMTTVNTAVQAINETPYQEADEDANEAKLKAAQAELATLEEGRETIQNQINSINEQIADIDNIKSLADLVKLVPDAENNDDYSDLVQLLKDIANLQGQISTLNGEIANLNTSISNLTNQIDPIEADLAELTTKDENGQTEIDRLKATRDSKKTANDTAQSALTAGNEAVTTTKAALDKAQADYDDAVEKASAGALANYKTITLTGDVTVDATINDNFAGGVINGNGHVLSLGDGVSSVFNQFSGIMTNVAVNGKFSNANISAAFNSVANWNGANTGVYYDVNGARIGSIATIGELGYLAREDFGVDFAKSQLVDLTDNSKVYDITIYEPKNGATGAQNYYNFVSGEFVNASLTTPTLNIPVNTFIKSASTDVDLDNVIFPGNKCKRAVVSDRQTFFCPYNITAEEVVYERSFVKGMNSVCLPFEMTYDVSANIEALCKYDREDGKFWFTRVEETIPANTPMLLVATEAFTLKGLTDVTINGTPTDQVVSGGNDTKNSKSVGIFKKVGPGEIEGSSQAQKVYGLATDGTFHPALESAVFPALRMVIFSGLTQVNPAPRRIGIHDENGIEITGWTTGIEDVETDASSLNIVGGQGQIIITSDADYGTVPVYAIDGKLVGQAEVVAGETVTVDVQKGIYIVLGKKVLVK